MIYAIAVYLLIGIVTAIILMCSPKKRQMFRDGIADVRWTSGLSVRILAALFVIILVITWPMSFIPTQDEEI